MKRNRCTNCGHFSTRLLCEGCLRSLTADGYEIENDRLPDEPEPEERARTCESGLTPLPPPLSRRRWFRWFS